MAEQIFTAPQTFVRHVTQMCPSRHKSSKINLNYENLCNKCYFIAFILSKHHKTTYFQVFDSPNWV